MGTTVANEQVTTKEEVRYLWLRDQGNRPVACVASEKNDSTLKFALAIHNPKDKFDKRMGRAVALARLRGNKHARFMSEINGIGFSVKNVKVALLRALAFGQSMFGSERLPERIREVAQYRLKNYKEPEQVAKEKEAG